ncbi:GspH/FimT family pseudopilin [Pseudomonas sp. NyZ704]|nr:GspH/FimT family pseudopilin [Pseudomonas sp. NyZ704]
MVSRGFTLVELLVALVVLGILISIGMPAFGKMIDQQRMDSGLSALTGSLNMARQEAVRRNRPVTLTAIEADWNNGWLMFLDNNRNGQLDAGEKLLREMAPDAVLRIDANKPVSLYVRFNGRGETQLLNGGFQAGTFRFCPLASSDHGRRLTINQVGRWRVESGPIKSGYCGF